MTRPPRDRPTTQRPAGLSGLFTVSTLLVASAWWLALHGSSTMARAWRIRDGSRAFYLFSCGAGQSA